MAGKRQVAVTARIVWGLVIVFLLITIISQLFIHYNNPIRTEPAMTYNSEEYIQTTGVYIRSEKYVNYNGTGIISYVYSDGEKLAKNAVVAQVYASQTDLALQLKIDELNKQIEVLRDAEKLIGSDNSQLEAFSNQIYECHTKIIQNIIDGEYAEAAGQKNDYLNLQSKRQIVNGTTSDYKDKISQLSGEISSLKAQVSSAPHDLTLMDTGYFVTLADGYETVLNYDAIPTLTEERIEEIIKNPELAVASNVIGKVISDYKWKMVCTVPKDNSMNIYENATLKVRIGSDVNPVRAYVENIRELESGKRMLVLSFDVFNERYIMNRTAQIKILFDETSGIRITSAAIHFDEKGEKGVFIKIGVNVHFRRVEVIRTEGDYTLVRDTTEKDGFLSLYDSVIVEGTELYDGKIIQQ